MNNPKADYEDDFWEEEPAPEGQQGQVADVSHGSTLADGILGLFGEVTKLHVALTELTEPEMAGLRGRLLAFKSIVSSLPETGIPPRRIGFEVPTRKRVSKKRIRRKRR